MHLHETLTYPSEPDAVFAVLSDPAWRESVCERVHATSWDVDVTPKGDGAVVTVTRTMPADVPDSIKKFLGQNVTVTQVETWGGPDAAGRREATTHLEVKGQPATMVGTVVLEPTATGSQLVVDGEVKVKVPFVGKKIEPLITKVMVRALREEEASANERLAG